MCKHMTSTCSCPPAVAAQGALPRHMLLCNCFQFSIVTNQLHSNGPGWVFLPWVFLYHCSNVVFIEYMYCAVWGVALPYIAGLHPQAPRLLGDALLATFMYVGKSEAVHVYSYIPFPCSDHAPNHCSVLVILCTFPIYPVCMHWRTWIVMATVLY